jgi:hypothetical protein
MEARLSRPGFGGVLTVWIFGVALVGCGPFGPSAPTICDQGERTELLKAMLVPWTPSAQFTLKSGATGWIQVTTLPESDEGLFGNVAGAAEVYSVHGGVPPNVTTAPNGDREPHDPSITIGKALTWQELPMGPGGWQLYSFSNPGIEVISCPGG